MHFKLFLYLIAFIGIARGCIDVTVSKYFDGNAANEEYYLYNSAGSALCHYKQPWLSLSAPTRYCNVCIEPMEEYKLTLIDGSSNGWGSYIANGSKVTITAFGMIIFSATLPYGDSVSKSDFTFTPGFLIVPNSNWQYTDSEQVDKSWTYSDYDSSSWSVTNSFPQFINTRYYRYSIELPVDYTTINSIEIGAIINNGYVLYINGQEVSRNNLPDGTITHTTPSTGADESNIYKRISVSGRQFVTSSTIVIAFEVHLFESQPSLTDSFNSFVRIDMGESSSRIKGFIDGIGNCYASYDAYSNEHCKNAFDGVSAYKWYGGSTQPFWIQFVFNNARRDWIGQYGLTSGNDMPERDPTAWRFLGSNDNVNYHLLDYQESQYFNTRRQTKYFNLPSNHVAYNTYKLEILSVVSANDVQLADILLLSTNTMPLEYGLIYPETSFSLNMGVNNVDVKPSSSGFYEFTCTPTLPEGISLNSNTGAISGIPTAQSSESLFHICATNGVDNQSCCIDITIIIIGCAQPLNSRFDITKINKSTGSTESWKMFNSNHELIMESTGSNNENQNWNMCVPAGIYTFELTDGGINGWDAGSMLLISMFGSGEDEATRYTLGKLTVMYVGSATYTINTKMSIWTMSGWKQQLVDSEIDQNWILSSYDDSQWLVSTSLIETTSRIWLYRKQFEFTDSSNYSGFFMRLYTNTGYIVYINGLEFYRYHVTEGNLSINSMPTLTEDVYTWKTISGKLSLLTEGINTISIAIVNTNENTQPFITTFDSTFILLCSSSEISRTWDINVNDSGHRDGESAINLFDYDKNTRYIVNINRGDIHYVQITYTNRAEYINKYCFTSNYDTPNHDPRSWNVYISNDNTSVYTLAATESDIFFDGRGERQCFFFENSKPAVSYKFEFVKPREDRETNSFALSEIELLLEDIESLVVPNLEYTPNTIQAYRNQYFPGLSISSPYYHHFNITPSLPNGLTLDYGDGQIMGKTSLLLASTVYTVTAVDHLGVTQTTTITISVESCNYPNVLFSLEFVFEEKGYEASYELYKQSTQELIDSRPSLISYSTSVYTYCHSATLYNLVLHDTANDGWGSGYYNVLLEDNTLLTTGTVSSGTSPRTVSINIGYIINPMNTLWKYYSGVSELDDSWILNSFDDSTWTTTPLTSISQLNSITNYFRYSFVPEDLSSFSNYEISIYSKGGFVVYFNGKEINRINLPLGSITSSTYATVSNTEWTKYSISLSIQLNNILSGMNTLSFEYHKGQEDDSTNNLACYMILIVDNTYRIIEGSYWSDSIVTGSEGTDKLFDNNSNTKVYRSGNGVGKQFTWIYANRREVINKYSIINADDCNTRHPSGWILEGSNDNTNYVSLNSQRGIKFTDWKQTKTFIFINDVAYQYYRLTITEMNNSKMSWLDICLGDNFQLAEFQLYTTRLDNPCPTIDGFPAVLNGGVSNKACPVNYDGSISRTCNDGVFSDPVENCVLSVPTIVYPNSPYIVIQNTTIASIIPQVQGLPNSFDISPVLPEGLLFDVITGIISGIPTVLSSNTEYTVTVSNASGSKSTNLFLTVDTVYCPEETDWPSTPIGGTSILECPDSINYEGSRSRACYMNDSPYWGDISETCTLKTPVIIYPSTSYSFFINISISPIIPEITYIVDSGFTVIPELPSGLTLDPVTGIITGTPLSLASTNQYVITALNSAEKSSSFELTLTVVSTDCVAEDNWPITTTGNTASISCTPIDIYEGYQTRTCTLSIWGEPNTSNCLLRYPYGITYPSIISVKKDFTMNEVTPTYQGQVDSWSIVPNLPIGLNFDTLTGTISGTATTEIESIYHITAINSRGSTSVTVTLHVVDTICDYDDWPHTEVGQTASKSCPDSENYDGQQTCVCLSGSPAYFGPVDTSACKKKAPTDILYTPASIIVNLGEPITMTPIFKYIVEDVVISPSLPNGLSLNKLTGVISGTSTVATSRVDYVLIFKNSDRSSNPVSITISIIPTVCYSENGWTETPKGQTATKSCDNSNLYEGQQTRVCIESNEGFSPYWGNINTSECKKRAPYSIIYPSTTIIGYVGDNISIIPTYSGLVESSTVSPSLPSGLSITTTGSIIGTLNSVVDEHEYSVVLKNSDNEAEPISIMITILRNTCQSEGVWETTPRNSFANAPCEDTTNYEGYRARYCSVQTEFTAPQWGDIDTSSCTKKAPYNIQYSVSTIYGVIGTAINVIPTFSGIVESITVSPALPNGLELSQTTGVISGTPSSVSTIGAYYLTFKNSQASSTPVQLNIVVVYNTCLTQGIWTETIQGQTLSIPCDDTDNYQGNQTRDCIAGGLGVSPSWGSVNVSGCKKRAPYNIHYNNIVGEYNLQMNVVPTVYGIVESVEIVPTLPSGLLFSMSTGVISGTPSTVTKPIEYTVIFKNSDASSTPYSFTIEIKGYCLETEGWYKTERGQTAFVTCSTGFGVQKRNCGISDSDMNYSWQSIDSSDCVTASNQDKPEYGFVYLYIPIQFMNVNSNSFTPSYQYSLRSLLYSHMKGYMTSMTDLIIFSMSSNSSQFFTDNTYMSLRTYISSESTYAFKNEFQNFTSSTTFIDGLKAIDPSTFENVQVQVDTNEIQQTNGPVISPLVMWIIIVVVVIVIVIIIIVVVFVVMKNKSKPKTKNTKILPKQVKSPITPTKNQKVTRVI